jgi:hypothetical protein
LFQIVRLRRTVPFNLRMETKPLSDRELKQLAKMDRRLSRGRLRFGLFGLCAGVVGGLGWVVLMWLMAPGFGRNWHITPPTGNEKHAVLEQIFYWLALHFGPIPALCILAGGMFGLMFAAFTYGLAWRLLVMNHANLARRALANRQFQPQYR